MVVRRAAFRELEGFDQSLALYEDWDLWIRLALRGDGVGVDAPLLGYRVWNSVSAAAGPDLVSAWERVGERHRAAAERLGARPDVADLHRYRAFRAMHANRRGEAAAAYRDLAALGGGAPAVAKASALSLASRLAGRQLAERLARRDTAAVPAEVRGCAEAWLAAAAPGPAVR